MLCLDIHVMSNYCQTCETTGKTVRQEEPQKYADWLTKHQDSCDKNYTGSSGMMEVEAARVLWGRSMQRHHLRYTTMLSDGDSKTFNELTRLQPYGEDHPITKEECINHVSKRLGTALRGVVTDCKKKGITLGGRGHGQLTGVAIDKLTKYYRRAIRANNSVESVSKSVKASLFHCFSTERKPQHELCPPGVKSWCAQIQRALAKHEVPGSHTDNIRMPLNEDRLASHLLPIL